MFKYVKLGGIGCIGIILFSFLSCTGCNYFLGEKIMQGKIFPGLVPNVYYFGTPKDLFTPVLLQEIDASKIDVAQAFKINHKYVGDYTVYMKIDNIHHKYIRNMSTKDLQFNIDIIFKASTGETYHRSVLCKPSLGLNSSDYFVNSVFDWVLKYNVPLDVPNGKDIDVEFTIHKNIENFREIFGNPSIEIKYYRYKSE